MARKIQHVTIDLPGRDFGKTFVLTEMSARQAESWGCRALLALMRSGTEIPENIASLGLAGIAVLGIQALGGAEWAHVEPLLNEMFECITIMPNPAVPSVVRGLVEDDIEDVKTRLFLRKEIMNLHVEFFTDAGLLSQAREAITATP